MKSFLYPLVALTLAACSPSGQEPIDREALVTRNNPHVTTPEIGRAHV